MPLYTRQSLRDKIKKAEEDSIKEIQFFLAVDGDSNRFFIGKKSDTELYCVNEKTKELTIIPNGKECGLKLIGECYNQENQIANKIINDLQ